jgi:hypothetical protein
MRCRELSQREYPTKRNQSTSPVSNLLRELSSSRFFGLPGAVGAQYIFI